MLSKDNIHTYYCGVPFYALYLSAYDVQQKLRDEFIGAGRFTVCIGCWVSITTVLGLSGLGMLCVPDDQDFTVKIHRTVLKSHTVFSCPQVTRIF